MDSLGGSTIFVDQTASRLNARESLYDIAHNLERWIDMIVLRTFKPRGGRRDGHLRGRSSDQCAQRTRASLPGAGRLLHAARAFRRSQEDSFRLTSATATTWRIRCCWRALRSARKFLLLRPRAMPQSRHRHHGEAIAEDTKARHVAHPQRSAQSREWEPMPSIPTSGPAWVRRQRGRRARCHLRPFQVNGAVHATRRASRRVHALPAGPSRMQK
jgi:hypothetical protein